MYRQYALYINLMYRQYRVKYKVLHVPVSKLGGSFCNVNINTFIGGYLWYGAVPVAISMAVIPNDQMSALKS